MTATPVTTQKRMQRLPVCLTLSRCLAFRRNGSGTRQQPQEEENGEGNKPIWKRRFPLGKKGGWIEASIFENQRESDGESFMAYSVSIRHMYFNQKDKKPIALKSFDESDLPIVAQAASVAYAALMESPAEQSGADDK